jgi:hypothetical protein
MLTPVFIGGTGIDSTAGSKREAFMSRATCVSAGDAAVRDADKREADPGDTPGEDRRLSKGP